jgi:quercetin dioxygenase-like cupin family protein
MIKTKLFPIDRLAEENDNYRSVIHTTPYNQVVLMSLDPGENIPKETHPYATQFVKVVSGHGSVTVNRTTQRLEEGDVVNIAPGFEHEISNEGEVPLKMYFVYSPPQHPDGLVRPRQ